MTWKPIPEVDVTKPPFDGECYVLHFTKSRTSIVGQYMPDNELAERWSDTGESFYHGRGPTHWMPLPPDPPKPPQE